MSLANEIDDRSTEEQLRDLDVLEKTVVEDVRWVRPYRSNPGAGLIKIGTSVIHLPDFITAELGDKLVIGTGRYQGRPVLLMRAVKTGERGYSHYKTKNGFKRLVNSPKLVEQLVKAGLKRGHYAPIKIKGGWMGIPKQSPSPSPANRKRRQEHKNDTRPI